MKASALPALIACAACLLAPLPARAEDPPQESFADTVLRLRSQVSSPDAASATIEELFRLHPRYTARLRKDLRAPKYLDFITRGDRSSLEHELNTLWLGFIESLLGPEACSGLKAAVEKAAQAKGENASRTRLDLYARLADIHTALVNLQSGGLDYALSALDRIPPQSPLQNESRESGLRAGIESLIPAFQNARTSVLAAARTGGAVDSAAIGRLSAQCAPLSRKALVLALRAAGCESIIYATRSGHQRGHFYESIGYHGPSGEYNYSRSGGRLSIWNLATDTVHDLVNDAEGGALRDPCVSYDGKTVLFSWRKTGSHYYHLYTIPVSGGRPTQLTDGEWNDIEPIWVPDGGIVFTSTRCHRWIPCNLAEVTNLHRCDADGKNIRMISSNVETETSPWMLPDGRLAYMRWEYTEKDRAIFHNLWTVHPDGTNHQLLFGNEYHLWDVWNDPKPVPGTRQVVFIAHNHGGPEHTGHVGIVDQLGGPNDHRRIRYLTQPYRNVTTAWRDPYPVTSSLILAARGPALVVLDQDGHEIELHRIQDPGVNLQEPRNLRPEPRPRVLPQRVDLTKDHGEFIIADVYQGRHMDGVRRGEAKDLLLIEELPKPVHHDGHTEPLKYNGTFMLERVLGTVPVEPDGSAYFQAPPLRSLMFVLRDADGLSIKRMQSFATLMPGERASCIGCHEARTEVSSGSSYLQALSRPPSTIEPIPGIPDVFSYPRDIQPILDRHCLPCHDGTRREGGVVLDGDMDAWFSQSYVTLEARDLVGIGARALHANMPPARSVPPPAASSGSCAKATRASKPPRTTSAKSPSGSIPPALGPAPTPPSTPPSPPISASTKPSPKSSAAAAPAAMSPLAASKSISSSVPAPPTSAPIPTKNTASASTSARSAAPSSSAPPWPGTPAASPSARTKTGNPASSSLPPKILTIKKSSHASPKSARPPSPSATTYPASAPFPLTSAR